MDFKIYSHRHNFILDFILVKKRNSIAKFLNNNLKSYKLYNCLDVGTSDDSKFKSSNYITKKLKNIKIFNSLSNQNIKSKFFIKKFKKSITEKLTTKDLKIMKADLVISNATIEHVGNEKNQLKMLQNIVKLTNQICIIITPNRFYPVDFHTKLPLLHFLPKKFHRKILKLIGFNFYSDEKNLNLLSKRDINKLIDKLNNSFQFKIYNSRFFFLTSNYIIIGKRVK